MLNNPLCTFDGIGFDGRHLFLHVKEKVIDRRFELACLHSHPNVFDFSKLHVLQKQARFDRLQQILIAHLLARTIVFVLVQHVDQCESYHVEHSIRLTDLETAQVLAMIDHFLHIFLQRWGDVRESRGIEVGDGFEFAFGGQLEFGERFVWSLRERCFCRLHFFSGQNVHKSFL